MQQIYDKKSSLVLPNGETWTVEDFAKSSFYKPLATVDCVVDVDGGVLTSFSTLAGMKAQWGVTTEDPEQALAEIQQKRAEAEQQAQEEAATVADLQAQMNALCGIES